MKLTPEEMEDLYPTVPDFEPKVDSNLDESIDDILAQRGSRYGSFESHAEISQELQKVVFMNAASNHTTHMPAYMVESLTLICHKLARIVNGDPFYDDSWKDIAGYSQLVVDILHGKNT
jgi:hypothetical protein